MFQLSIANCNMWFYICDVLKCFINITNEEMWSVLWVLWQFVTVKCLNLHLHVTVHNYEVLSGKFYGFNPTSISHHLVQLPQATSSHSHKKSKKKKKHSSKTVRSQQLCTSHLCSVKRGCSVSHDILSFPQSNGYDDDLSTLSSRVSGPNNRVMIVFEY